MTAKISKNVAIGVLVACLSVVGCRKKAADVVDNGGDNVTPDSTVTEKTNVSVTPEPVRSDPVRPVDAAPIKPVVAPVAAKPVQVVLETTKGEIVLELSPQAAPITVANFLRYVREGFYEGTVFHRVIAGFMIQGGGMTADMVEKKTHSPINNEASNGLKNARGTIAMARQPMPDSATSQFYINHGDNKGLDYGTCEDGYGYAVFGKVIKGMDVVDTIASAPTTTRNGHENVPVQPISITKTTVVQP